MQYPKALPFRACDPHHLLEIGGPDPYNIDSLRKLRGRNGGFKKSVNRLNPGFKNFLAGDVVELDEAFVNGRQVFGVHQPSVVF